MEKSWTCHHIGSGKHWKRKCSSIFHTGPHQPNLQATSPTSHNVQSRERQHPQAATELQHELPIIQAHSNFSCSEQVQPAPHDGCSTRQQEIIPEFLHHREKWSRQLRSRLCTDTRSQQIRDSEARCGVWQRAEVLAEQTSTTAENQWTWPGPAPPRDRPSAQTRSPRVLHGCATLRLHVFSNVTRERNQEGK